MPLIVGILLFLTTLAAAAALTLSGAALRLSGSERLTVQVMTAHPTVREADAKRALTLLKAHPGITSVRRVTAAEMQRLLEPWLGGGAEVPVPALIEADVRAGADQAAIRRAVALAVPSAIVNAEAQWLAPVREFVSLLRWLSAGLALVTLAGLAAVVSLAARASLAMHDDTIGLMHLLGATDRQLVRMFERRAGLEVLLGGMAGWLGAMLALLLVIRRWQALGDVPLATPGGPLMQMLALLTLPLGGALLAMLVARITLLRALNANR